MRDSGTEGDAARVAQEGERIICTLRLAIAVTLTVSVAIASFLIRANSGVWPPFRLYLSAFVFLAYAVLLFLHVRRYPATASWYRYFCVVLDVSCVSAVLWVVCSFPEIEPPRAYLPLMGLYYVFLILIGSFRFSMRAAVFSGVFTAAAYAIVIAANYRVLQLPYYAVLGEKHVSDSFSIYFEGFRILGMLMIGIITALASRHRLRFFNSMAEAEKAANLAMADTVSRSRSMAGTLRASTDEIFKSSKIISETANAQGGSIGEVKTALDRNTGLTMEIAEKTVSVVGISGKLEDEVLKGFSLLERNSLGLQDIRDKNDRVMAGICELGNKTGKIGESIRAIDTITDHTKVIAFNAALEAASAGENGHRFAVVANEVNRLADDIAELTRTIRAQLARIQNSSTELIVSGEENSEKITEGNNLIRQLEDVFRKIRSYADITQNQADSVTSLAENQRESARQLHLAIQDISSGLGSFVLSTELVSSSAENLARMTGELEDLLGDVPGAVPKSEVANLGVPGAECP
ncbi:MAG: methyl-accepting chemotaxis protein [Treponema sp.]|nr:methyl-accepting chemotaxis protein [Treponema sp.]